MNQNIINEAAEIVKKNTVKERKYNGEICTLTLIDEEGYPTSSIITPSKSDGIKWITFGTLLDGNRAKRSKACKYACVCFGTDEYCVNLVGDIEVVTTADVKRGMWYDGLAFHFKDSEDPNYCVLKFTTIRYKLFINGEDVEGRL